MSRRSIVEVFLGAWMSACTGVDEPVARDAWLQIPGSRYVAGPMPVESDGPTVTAIDSPNNTIRPGQRGKSVSGRTDARAYSLAFGLAGDRGYWIVPVGLRSVLYPGEIEFATSLDFSAQLPPGALTLRIEAGDAAGHFGTASTLDFTAVSLVANATLVVSLDWDQDADLDLWVDLPDGTRLSERGLRGQDGRVVQVDPSIGPLIDADSNARCVIDGRRAENALWQSPLPGHYVVSVETWSLCGETRASYNVDVRLRGTTIAAAQGASFDNAPPTTGTAWVVAEFDIAP